MRYDISMTVETISLLPDEVERELERILLDSPDLLIRVDFIHNQYSGDLSLARRKITKHFFETPFVFGFSHYHNIAYGIGWGSALLKEVLVDFYDRGVTFMVRDTSPHDTVVKKKFKTMKGCFKLLPKTEKEFDRVIENEAKIKANNCVA